MLSAPSASSASSKLPPRAQVPTPTSRSKPSGALLDDFEAFTSSTSQLKLDTSPNGAAIASNAPAVPATDNDDEDDFLGLLGKPVSAVRQSPSQSSAPESATPITSNQKPQSSLAPTASSPYASNVSSRPPSRAVAARTPSPPPHVLGQVVSMGFSVQQARLALAATLQTGKSGEARWDVGAAVEVLASDGAANAQRQREKASSGRPASYNGEADERRTSNRGHAGNGRQASPKSSRSPQDGREQRRGSPRPESDQQGDLLAQASGIGLSMLKSANAYWKVGRAQIQKTLEENKFLQQASLSPNGEASPNATGRSISRNGTPSTGRPKWMTSDHADDDMDDQPKVQGSFKDSDDESGDSVLPAHPSDRSGGSQSTSSTAQTSQIRKAQTLSHDEPDLLSGNFAERRSHAPASSTYSSLKVPEPERPMYSSPNRRRTPMAASASAAAATAGPQTKTPDRRGANSPRPVVSPRPRVTATPNQLATSQKYKAKGNELFKIGRYGEAVEQYHLALDALPEKHLSRIHVLNNRANARLKIGEERQASEDCTEVLILLLGDNTPVKIEDARKEHFSVVLHELDAGGSASTDEPLDPHDALGKALARRAKSCEANEKWRQAMHDWQTLHELGNPKVLKSAGGIKVVNEGLNRCRKAVDGPSKPTTAAARPPPPVQPKVTRSRAAATAPPVPSKPSSAVTALRVSAKQAEADDAERFRLKDSIDAKILQWKGGKEKNLRALLASLDSVLWEGLGWKTVGMHELITDSQLKIRYVRAVSKVHPDKVRPDCRVLWTVAPTRMLIALHFSCCSMKLPPDTTVEHRMIADAVFSALSDAWNSSS